MKRKMKYLLIVFLFLFLGCSDQQEKKESTINYYYLDILLDLNPKTYVEGQGCVLPTYELDGYEFIGWYKNADFSSWKLTNISIFERGDINLYCKMNEIPIIEKEGLISFEDIYNLNDATSEFEIQTSLPNTGGNVLVVPVAFSDSELFNNEEVVKNLGKAFFGSELDTGWESVKTYYLKSSYGIANISGDVLDICYLDNTIEYYDTGNSKEKLNEIIEYVVSSYDDYIDYSRYDNDKNGYIDAIYLVYLNVANSDENSIYWAFSDEYISDDMLEVDSVSPGFYTFISYYFLFDKLANGESINLNTESFIHETGHLFGLDDYYDYNINKGEDGGLGGADMMDSNIGDHNPYSKLLLNWIKPKAIIDSSILNCDYTFNIKAFCDSGDVILIYKEWSNSLYDEYIMIDYYSCDGLNDLEKGNEGLFDANGIRIHLVNSQLDYNPDNLWLITKYDNSFTRNKLIKLIQADGLNEIEKENALADNGDLFMEGNTLDKIKWASGKNANFEIIIDKIDEDNAQITIHFLEK